MRKIAKELLKNNDSYIVALEKAITFWNAAETMEDKRDFIVAIGEIGNLLHKENMRLKIAHMEV